MATVILRPTADSSLQHSCSSGSSGHALISEATADGDSTYIYQTITSENVTSKTSWFHLSSPPTKKFKINSYTAYGITRHTGETSGSYPVVGSTRFCLNINGTLTYGNVNFNTNSYTETTMTYEGFNGITFVDFENSDAALIGVVTSGYKSRSKNDNFQVRFTQVYVVLDYEPVTETATGIYLKQNGAYTQAQAAYKKVNGVWVQQTDIATLKTEIQSGKYKSAT